jgi:PEP-CTERM motif
MNSKKLLLLSAMSLFSIAITRSASATEFITNGGFETGDFSSWTILESNNAPRISNTVSHSGTYSALLGNVPPESEALGNSWIQSNLTAPLPAGAMLSFWWQGLTSDTITFDWQDAYITNAAGTILSTVMHTCATTNGFQNVTFSLAAYAGQQVHVEFLDHQDGFGDDTAMWVDDVSIQGVVPEPSVASLALLGFGALAATGIVRRMRRSAA